VARRRSRGAGHLHELAAGADPHRAGGGAHGRPAVVLELVGAAIAGSEVPGRGRAVGVGACVVQVAAGGRGGAPVGPSQCRSRRTTKSRNRSDGSCCGSVRQPTSPSAMRPSPSSPRTRSSSADLRPSGVGGGRRSRSSRSTISRCPSGRTDDGARRRRAAVGSWER
jgi:hypothetical protein